MLCSRGPQPCWQHLAVPEDAAPDFDAQAFLKSLTHKAGVYRMLDESGEVLYVGKAKDLKKRVASYFGSKAHLPKTQLMPIPINPVM